MGTVKEIGRRVSEVDCEADCRTISTLSLSVLEFHFSLDVLSRASL